MSSVDFPLLQKAQNPGTDIQRTSTSRQIFQRTNTLVKSRKEIITLLIGQMSVHANVHRPFQLLSCFCIRTHATDRCQAGGVACIIGRGAPHQVADICLALSFRQKKNTEAWQQRVQYDPAADCLQIRLVRFPHKIWRFTSRKSAKG